MIKIKNVIFFLFFITSSIYAQNANILVEYDYRFLVIDVKAFLVSNNKESYFIFTQDTATSYDQQTAKEFKGINPYYIHNYDHTAEIGYQISHMIRKPNGLPELVRDNFDVLSWTLLSEKKKILGYDCTRAKTTFRGRNYKVWFTTDIATNAFPWKLKGLPALILEFEDETGQVKGYAKSVAINKEQIFPETINSFFNQRKKGATSYRDFITVENKVLTDIMNEKIANLPKGTSYKFPELRQFYIEKSFEWEAAPAKP